MKKSLTIFLLLLWQQPSFAQQVNTDNLNKLLEFCDATKADEILISHKGSILTHWKRTDFSQIQGGTSLAECNTPFMGTASMVKSWTGLVIGILVDKGLIKNIDELVCNYIPEWEAGCSNKITIRHLLTMTAGMNRLGASGVLSKADMNHYVRNMQPDTLPGIRFSYSNESVQLLGILIEKVTEKKADDAFEKYLFQPMRIDSTTLSKDSVGNVILYGGCTTTVHNAHKMGMLMLKKGVFDGQRIVSEQWINESTTPGSLVPYYGYLWWIDKNSKYWNYAATGDLGQMTIVFPELDLVFVRKQSCDLSPASRNMSWMGPKFLELITRVVN
ncbi:MAG: serine hydrolase domain-containing protein [Saprospiraceae bacterium]